MEKNDVGSLLLWKFVPVKGRAGEFSWKWEAWTHSGQLVASSEKLYATFIECEDAAKMEGYVHPDNRRSLHLTAEATHDIVGVMNAILADVFALYFKTKNFHWHL